MDSASAWVEGSEESEGSEGEDAAAGVASSWPFGEVAPAVELVRPPMIPVCQLGHWVGLDARDRKGRGSRSRSCSSRMLADGWPSSYSCSSMSAIASR